MARPTKYTPSVVSRILDALAAGNTRRAAAMLAGVGQNTFGDWLRRYRDFRDDVEKAEARAEARNVALIARAAQDNTWTAAAWWLERRRREDWGRLDRIDVTIQVRDMAERIAEHTGIAADDLIREAERIAAMADRVSRK